MTFLLKGGVSDTTTTTGTGDITLVNSPPAGFRSLDAAASTSDTFPYALRHLTEPEWEEGIGTYSGSHVFVRTVITASSNAGAAVSFSAGTKRFLLSQTERIVTDLRAPTPPQGRLSLESGVAFSVADQATKTNVYYGFDSGGLVPVWDGYVWRMYDITAELTLALDSDSGHTGYQQSGFNFDLWLAYVAGTFYFGTGPAWTSDTARAAATALARKNGIYTNNTTMTLRHGASSGNTVSVPANQATYLGTMRASANGQTQIIHGAHGASGTAAFFGIWNAYNRRRASWATGNTTSSWTYTSTTWRSVNADAGIRCSMIRGLNENAVLAQHVRTARGSTTSIVAYVGVGVNSTSANSAIGSGVVTAVDATGHFPATARYSGHPGLGFHFLQALEASSGSTSTFITQALINGGLSGELWY